MQRVSFFKNEMFNLELNTSKSKTHLLEDNEPKEINPILMLISIQKIIFDNEFIGKLVRKQFYMLIKGIFNNDDDANDDNRYSLPRMFVHNNTTKCLTEVVYGDTQMNFRVAPSPPSLVPAAILKHDNYLFFVPNRDVYAPTSAETFNVKFLTRLENGFKKQFLFFKSRAPMPHRDFRLLYSNPNYGPAEIHLIIIPLTPKLDIQFLIDRLFNKNIFAHSTKTKMWMLITKNRRIFFRRESEVVCYLQTAKQILESPDPIFFRRMTNTVELVDRNTNWLGALFFAQYTNNKLKVPHATVFYPSRNHFLQWPWDDFNFVSHFFQTGLKRDAVEIWLQGDDLRNDTDALMFDSIPYNFNCLVHIIESDREQGFGYDYNFPAGFLKVFVNCKFEFNGGHSHRFEGLSHYESDNFISPTQNYSFFLDGFYFSTVIHLLHYVLENFVKTHEKNGLHRLLLKLSSITNEELLRECIIHFNAYCLKRQKENELTDSEMDRFEYFMTELIMLNSNNNNNNKDIIWFQRYFCLKNNNGKSRVVMLPTIDKIKFWFYRHGICAFELCHPQNSRLVPHFFPVRHDYTFLDSVETMIPVSTLTNRRDIFIYSKKSPASVVNYFILPSFSFAQVLQVLQYLSTSWTLTESVPEPLVTARKTIKYMNVFLSMRCFLSKIIRISRDSILMDICDALLHNVNETSERISLWHNVPASNLSSLNSKINSMIVYLIETFNNNAIYGEWKMFKLLFSDDHNHQEFGYDDAYNDVSSFLFLSDLYFISKVIILFELLSLNDDMGTLYKLINNKLLKINTSKFVNCWLQKFIPIDNSDTLAGRHWNVLQEFVTSLFALKLAKVDNPRIRIKKQKNIFYQVGRQIDAKTLCVKNFQLFIDQNTLLRLESFEHFIARVNLRDKCCFAYQLKLINCKQPRIFFVANLKIFIKYCSNINIKNKNLMILCLSALIYITREINNYISPASKRKK